MFRADDFSNLQHVFYFDKFFIGALETMNERKHISLLFIYINLLLFCFFRMFAIV